MAVSSSEWELLWEDVKKEGPSGAFDLYLNPNNTDNQRSVR
jgi:hypothetical protein